MNRLLQISRSPEEFARFSRCVSIGVIVGFVVVIALMLGQVVLRGQ